MTDAIFLKGLEVFGYHGVLQEEAENGQRFLVDIELRLDTMPAARGDDLSKTVDYGILADRVVELATRERFSLIETLAHRICELCLESNPVEMCTVTVHKPQAPIAHPFEDVSVTVTLPR